MLARDAGALFVGNSVSALSACLQAAVQETLPMKRRAESLSARVREQYDWSASARRLESIAALCQSGTTAKAVVISAGIPGLRPEEIVTGTLRPS